MRKELTAIILAAGPGTRLKELTQDAPKALVVVSGQTLVARSIAAAEEFGATKIVVVGGYLYPKLKEEVQAKFPEIVFVENKEFATTRRFVSLYLAESEIQGDLIFFDVDYIFKRVASKEIPKWFGKETLYFSTSIRSNDTEQDGFITKNPDGTLEDILTEKASRDLRKGENYATAIMFVPAEEKKVFFEAIEEHLATGAPASTKIILDRYHKKGGRVMVTDLGLAPWVEVDTQDDLVRARNIVGERPLEFISSTI